MFPLADNGCHGLAPFRLHDPHKAADAWIAASEAGDTEALERLRDEATALLTATRKESARSLEARKRFRDPASVKACAKRWRESHRDYCSAYMRDFRARQKVGDPEAYEKTLADARERKKRNYVPRPRAKLTSEEAKARKREWDREYQRTHPRKYTEEQLEARRAHYRKVYRDKVSGQEFLGTNVGGPELPR